MGHGRRAQRCRRRCGWRTGQMGAGSAQTRRFAHAAGHRHGRTVPNLPHRDSRRSVPALRPLRTRTIEPVTATKGISMPDNDFLTDLPLAGDLIAEDFDGWPDWLKTEFDEHAHDG